MNSTIIATPQCPPGNSDLYGIGVRVGLYAQWTATLLATLFEPRTESTYRIANLIIQWSIFLGLCTQSRPGDSLIGAVITQYLLFGSLSSLTGDGISHFSHFSGIFRVVFYTAVSSYGCWFWFRGIDAMHVAAACPDIAFFGRVSLHGWFRTLGKVMSVVGVVLCVASLAFSVWATGTRFNRGFREGFKKKEKVRPRVELALLALSMALIGMSIYLVEHLISVNDVQEVGIDEIGTVGQLIPLLAGGLACGLTLWRVVAHRLFLRPRCWFLFGYHL
ncbi:hypothetical protein MKX07_008566 [Trichoderma sp. CBMAI-0711]|uniref:Uncharacterized protein n=1 Tax=Trichoderma parareesei TaxID=858221 RepID=A0A2H3ACE3_TRIPA|nr:hypothetical protein MKX07_008566 [Trichoderma sp. CBMAI-0711]OTA08614.1 hypothetical protein A9Z42_0003160 [Trichoderma parareesei]